MNPKFDDPQRLIDGGVRVEACGPTNFAPDEVSARIKITIMQNGVEVHGESPPVFRYGDAMWELVTSAAGLKAGAAHGVGHAKVRHRDGQTDTVTWERDFTLR